MMNRQLKGTEPVDRLDLLTHISIEAMNGLLASSEGAYSKPESVAIIAVKNAKALIIELNKEKI